MHGITDIHCHVLSGVDDGAHDTEQSMEMLRFMYNEGIRNVILTPHYHAGHVEPDVDLINARFRKLARHKEQDWSLADLRLYLGCEIYYYPSIVSWLDEGRVLSMAGSDYVLLEFGYTMEKREIYEGITEVVNAGYRPIIAHVERYEKLVGHIDLVDELIAKGAYIQVNCRALERGFRIRSFVKKLLREEMVHFLATDAHDMMGRAPEMANAVSYVSKHFGEDYCNRIVADNPVRVINNEYIDP